MRINREGSAPRARRGGEATADDLRSSLVSRLRSRRAEIEEAIATRMHALADPERVGDDRYAEGLRSALSVAIDYGLIALEQKGKNLPPAPLTLLSQARLAARHGIPLDTVLRRCFAGYTLLIDFIIQEAGQNGALPARAVRDLLQTPTLLFDRLVAAVTDEYTREAALRSATTPEQRRAQQVRSLLAAEPVDASELGYPLEGWHLAALMAGEGVDELVRDLARAFDRRLLMVSAGEGIRWAWLGGRRQLAPAEIEQFVASRLSSGTSLAVGEPGEGISGWRLTHRQAASALPIAQRRPGKLVRYRDVALLASILRDELLTASLRHLYLAPLQRERDRGKTLIETLRAYFAADRHISSTASILGVSRQTVSSRLRTIEQKLDRSLADVSADIHAALQIEQFGASAPLPNRSL